MALEIDALIQEAVTSLKEDLDTVLDALEAESGLTIPRVNDRHIRAGLEPLQGFPVQRQTLWVYVPQVVTDSSPINLRGNAPYQDVVAEVRCRAFLLLPQGSPDLAERISSIYGEAIRRVWEFRLNKVAFRGTYFNQYLPSPQPISNEAVKGTVRELELSVLCIVRQRRYHQGL